MEIARRGIAASALAFALAGSASAQDVATPIAVTVPDEVKVRVVNPYGNESISVAVDHDGGTKGGATVLRVPSDHYFVLTDVEITRASPTGEYALGDGSGAQLFLLVDGPLVRQYRSGVIFAPGATVRVESATNPDARFALRGTFMGKLQPLE